MMSVAGDGSGGSGSGVLPAPVAARPVAKAGSTLVSAHPVAHPRPPVTVTKATVKQTKSTTKTVAQTATDGSGIDKCGADNIVNFRSLLHNTPCSVVSHLQLVYASVFNTFDSVYPVHSVFYNCGGKCVALIITSLASIVTQADNSLQRLKICKVRNKGCLNRVKMDAVVALSKEKPKIVNCFSTLKVRITFNKDALDKISSSFVDGTMSAIQNAAATLDNESGQTTVASGTVTTATKPIPSQGNNGKKPVAIVTPSRVQTQPQTNVPRSPSTATSTATTKGQVQAVKAVIQNAVKPKPATVPQPQV